MLQKWHDNLHNIFKHYKNHVNNSQFEDNWQAEHIELMFSLCVFVCQVEANNYYQKNS